MNYELLAQKSHEIEKLCERRIWMKGNMLSKRAPWLDEVDSQIAAALAQLNDLAAPLMSTSSTENPR